MREIAIAIFHGLGDCINATSLLVPISKKHKDCKITWISSERYIPLIYHNPYIADYQVVKGNPFAADAQIKVLMRKYKNLIAPAPYLNPPGSDGTLLGSFKDRIRQHGTGKSKFRPLMYLTQKEIADSKNWLTDREIGKFVMIEALFTSSQAFWNRDYTNIALEIFKKKGYTVLFTHRNDQNISEYNDVCPTFCMDVGFRCMPAFYNLSQGFIGVSSGISCVVHTHQSRLDIPHLEFVSGKHWCTKHYEKKNKRIIFNKNKDHFRKIIQKNIV